MASSVVNSRPSFSLSTIPSKVADGCSYLLGKLVETVKRVFNSIDRKHAKTVYFSLITIGGISANILINTSHSHITAIAIGIVQGILFGLGDDLTR